VRACAGSLQLLLQTIRLRVDGYGGHRIRVGPNGKGKQQLVHSNSTTTAHTATHNITNSIVFLMKPLSESKLAECLLPHHQNDLYPDTTLTSPLSILRSPTSPVRTTPPPLISTQSLQFSSFKDDGIITSSPTLFASPSLPRTTKILSTQGFKAKKKISGDGADIPYRILCVEDNAVNLKVITRQLMNFGFTVDVASDGAEAVRQVMSHPLDYYCAVLMDLQMPMMDGFMATSKIREYEALHRSANGSINESSTPSEQPSWQIPIVALTASVMPGVIQQCEDVGMNAYISKPIQIPQLLKALNNLSLLVPPEPELRKSAS